MTTPPLPYPALLLRPALERDASMVRDRRIIHPAGRRVPGTRWRETSNEEMNLLALNGDPVYNNTKPSTRNSRALRKLLGRPSEELGRQGFGPKPCFPWPWAPALASSVESVNEFRLCYTSAHN